MSEMYIEIKLQIQYKLSQWCCHWYNNYNWTHTRTHPISRSGTFDPLCEQNSRHSKRYNQKKNGIWFELRNLRNLTQPLTQLDYFDRFNHTIRSTINLRKSIVLSPWIDQLMSKSLKFHWGIISLKPPLHCDSDHWKLTIHRSWMPIFDDKV